MLVMLFGNLQKFYAKKATRVYVIIEHYNVQSSNSVLHIIKLYLIVPHHCAFVFSLTGANEPWRFSLKKS